MLLVRDETARDVGPVRMVNLAVPLPRTCTLTFYGLDFDYVVVFSVHPRFLFET